MLDVVVAGCEGGDFVAVVVVDDGGGGGWFGLVTVSEGVGCGEEFAENVGAGDDAIVLGGMDAGTSLPPD